MTKIRKAVSLPPSAQSGSGRANTNINSGELQRTGPSFCTLRTWGACSVYGGTHGAVLTASMPHGEATAAGHARELADDRGIKALRSQSQSNEAGLSREKSNRARKNSQCPLRPWLRSFQMNWRSWLEAAENSQVTSWANFILLHIRIKGVLENTHVGAQIPGINTIGLGQGVDIPIVFQSSPEDSNSQELRTTASGCWSLENHYFWSFLRWVLKAINRFTVIKEGYR